ncbi:MAG: stage II sporulation protein M [Eubacteriales bacterium]|nr:stage II sporulation protein M [Eubacteriales bacterium]
MRKQKIKEMLFWGFLFTGFAAGVLFVNLWGNTYLGDISIFGPEQMKTVAGLETDPGELFRYLVFERAKGILLLWLLGYTVAGIPAALFTFGWLGAAAGILLSTCIIEMRLAGIIVFLTALLPQWLVYMPMIWMLCTQIYDKGIVRYQKGRYFDNWEKEKQYLSILLLTAALLAAGAVLETFASPWLMRQVVNFFYNL